MAFARGFFELQFLFAERVRDLSGMPLEAALLQTTNLYVRLGFGRDFDDRHEGWQEYLSGLSAAGDGPDWTVRFYLRDPEVRTAPPADARFGCFSYAWLDDERVKLHFRNTEADDRSPLDVACVERRRAELTALSAHLKGRVSGDAMIVGASWLYNLESYRRLFPPGYVSSARPVSGGFRSMALWGQFLDRSGELRESAVARFRENLARATGLDDLVACFPLPALATRTRAREFHDFYGV